MDLACQSPCLALRSTETGRLRGADRQYAKRTHLVAFQPLNQGLGRKGPAEEIPLDKIASHSAENGQGLLVLHALGDDAQAEVMTEIDNGMDDEVVLLVARKVRDEGPVDLDFIHGQTLEVGEGRVSCP